MLSLKNNNKPLAQIDNSADNTIKKHKKKEKKYIYYKECSPDDEAEIATTPEQKLKIFKSFLSRYKDLKKSEITTFIEYFKSGVEELENRSQNKIYSKGVDFVNNSLKRYLDYGDGMSLFPVINDPSYRMYITALSGSGKSYFCKEWVKHNPPRGKESGVFLFSPVEEDESLKGIKNLIHLKLENYEQEYEKTPYPSCQENLPFTQLFSLIKLLELFLISRIRSGMGIAGFKPTKTWTWSETPFTIMGF